MDERLLENRVRIRVRTLSPERLINRAVEAGVPLSAIRRESARVFSAELPARQWPVFKKILRGTGSTIRVTERRGPFFLWRKIRPHGWFLIALIFLAILLQVFCGRIWMIRVVPSAGLDETLLLGRLRRMGVSVGMKNDGETLRALEQQMMIEYGDYPYLALDGRGMVLRVRADAALPKPAVGAEGERKDVIARCDGVIEQIHVYRGTAAVQPGDTVRRGQILIVGTEVSGEKLVPVNANGDVIARVWYTGAAKCPTSGKIFIPTGREICVRQFQSPWNCDIIQLSSGFSGHARADGIPEAIGYEHFDAVQTAVPLLDGLFLNMSRVTTEFRELTAAEQRLEPHEAREQAYDQALKNALEKMPLGTAPDRFYAQTEPGTDAVTVRVTLEALVPIGKTVKP